MELFKKEKCVFDFETRWSSSSSSSSSSSISAVMETLFIVSIYSRNQFLRLLITNLELLVIDG